MQSALWKTLLLILALYVDSSQSRRKKCQCPALSSGSCNIPSGCRCPLVRALCADKPKATIVGKRNAGAPLSDLDFLTFNRNLRQAEALMELLNKDIYSSPRQRSRLRRWKTND